MLLRLEFIHIQLLGFKPAPASSREYEAVPKVGSESQA